MLQGNKNNIATKKSNKNKKLEKKKKRTQTEGDILI